MQRHRKVVPSAEMDGRRGCAPESVEGQCQGTARGLGGRRRAEDSWRNSIRRQSSFVWVWECLGES